MTKSNVDKREIWKDLLHEIYSPDPILWTEDHQFNLRNVRDILGKKLKLNKEEFQENIAFLEEMGLVKSKTVGRRPLWSCWELTEKGFTVALENEKAKGTQALQIVVSLGGTILALIALIGFLDTILPKNIWKEGTLFVLFILLIACTVGLVCVITPLINKAIKTKW